MIPYEVLLQKPKPAFENPDIDASKSCVSLAERRGARTVCVLPLNFRGTNGCSKHSFI